MNHYLQEFNQGKIMSINKKAIGYLTTIFNDIKVNSHILLSHSTLLSKFETIESVLAFVNESDQNVANVYYELSRINKKNVGQSRAWLNSKLDSLAYNLTNKVLAHVDNMCIKSNSAYSLVILDAKTEQLIDIAIPYDNTLGIVPCDKVIHEDMNDVYIYFDSESNLQLVNAKEMVEGKTFILIKSRLNEIREMYSFFNDKLNVNMFKNETEERKQFAIHVLNKSLFDDTNPIVVSLLRQHFERPSIITVRLTHIFHSFVKKLINLAIDSVGSNVFTVSHCPIKGAIWNIPVGVDTTNNNIKYCELYMDQLALNLITGKSLKNVLYATNHTFKRVPLTVHEIHDFVLKYNNYSLIKESR